MKRVTFNELRKIKDALPSGSIQQIATELNLPLETVKNYFGAINSSTTHGGGIHIDPGPNGGIVLLEDPTILEKALVVLGEIHYNISTI